MTILPKKKSSQPKPDRDGAGGVDSVQYSPRGLSQNQVWFFLCVCVFSGQTHYVWFFIMADFCLQHLVFLSLWLSPFFRVFWSLFESIFRKVWTLGQSNDVSTMGVTLYYFPLRYCLIIKSLRNTWKEVIIRVLLQTLSSILLEFL